MKRIIVILLLIAFADAGSGHISAQEHKIMLYPFYFWERELTMEYAFTPKKTRMGYGAQVSVFVRSTKERSSGAIFSPYIKVYMGKKEKPNAWYFKTQLLIGGAYAAEEAYFRESDYLCYAPTSFASLGIGASFGKQWMFKNGFSLDFALGLRYQHRFGMPQEVRYNGRQYDLLRFMGFGYFCDWGMYGPGRFFDLQLGLGYTFPVKK